MADSSIWETELYASPWIGLDCFRKLPVWPGRNRGLGEMTTDYSQAQYGKKIFGISLAFFSRGLTWFGFSTPAGIFTLRQLNTDVAFFRAEIVIAAIAAAYGVLVWRSASHKLSILNYIVMFSCVAVLLVCASEVSEWVYFLDHQGGFLFLKSLEILVFEIAIPVCIFVFGGWWGDSTFMHERLLHSMRSIGLVK
jgi:amino acid permease